MRIENSFEVAQPIERVWEYLLDVEKVVPCMPGAELTETIDERNYRGRVKIKIGPVGLTFSGKVTMEERDDAAHRVVLKATGTEQTGKGVASATVTSTLEGAGDATRVAIVQDLNVSGQAAQLSRGMMQDISSKLTQQFADCLQANMSAEGAPSGAGPAPRATAKPVGGIRLALGALGRAFLRFWSRLFKRNG